MEHGQLVWLITGTSSGFGKELVFVALERGDRVLATVRKLEDAPHVPDEHRSRLHFFLLDVTDSAENIEKAVNAAAAVWGQVDVLVNNAGYSVGSIVEEASVETWTRLYQTNIGGVINVTNAVLPHMRARRSGTIIMMGSRAAWQSSTPFMGFYNSSKAAVHSLGETYSSELKPFGIRVCIAAPGAFRTDTLGHMYSNVDHHIADYDPLRPVGQLILDSFKQVRGDPRKAMNLLADAVRGEGRAKGRELPLYLFMGEVTYDRVREYCAKMEQCMSEWEDLARDLDLDESEADGAA